MLSRRSLLFALPSAAIAADPKFVRSFFYLKPDSKLIFTDFAFGSDRRGWAFGGTIDESRRVKGVQLATTDGGQTWTQTELKFVPRSFFPLNDTSLWAVSEKGEIWFSAESGLQWKKLSTKENALRVHFIDNEHGFLVGRKKTFMRSDDGGKTWRHIPEAAQVTGNPDLMTYRWVQFWNGKIGLATGSAEPQTRRNRSELPDWMEPEIAGYKNTTPRAMISLETSDGGATWRKSEVSGFGQIHRSVIGSDGTGLTLVKFDKSFAFGGELYAFYPKQNKKSERILRLKDLEFQDILYIPGDGAYLACTERMGGLPVPTKVKIKHSSDLQNWRDISVDYRAVALSIVLSSTPSGKVFASLDSGTILVLKQV